MKPEMMRRIAFMVTLLEKLKVSLLATLGDKMALSKFFDFDDSELDERLGELLEKEEWGAPELLELAAFFLTMYLKDEYEERHGI